jgi:hypothetical protein
MRTHACGGILCLVLAATLAAAGDPVKEKPFKEMSTEDLNSLIGSWEAVVSTENGWKGTLRASVALKRNNSDVSTFHHFMVVKYDLRYTDKKKKKDAPGVSATANGTERIALLPFQKDRQLYLQCLKDFQIQQREYLLDLLDFRPDDKKAAKELAALLPTKRDTAASWIDGSTWTLDTAPILLEFLPKRAPSGLSIDWEPRIVWTKVKSK